MELTKEPDDADVGNALTQSSQGFLLNSGQICVAATRLLVQEEIAEKFTKGLKARFEMFAHAMGDQMSEQTFLGPLADQKQTENVLSFFTQAKKDGVQFLTGGHRHYNGGNIIQPTIMEDPPLGSSVWKQEIFGPALGIDTFETAEEAIELANDSTCGLSACVYTSDVARALRVTALLETGPRGRKFQLHT